jgi:phospholipase/carboxylesterase
MPPFSRRAFCHAAIGTGVLLAACRTSGSQPAAAAGAAADPSRLRARPTRPTSRLTAGRHPLGLGTDRDGFVYVPPSYDEGHPAPLLILLHGAGQSAALWTRWKLDELFGGRGVVVLAPDSRESTWDVRLGGFGPDVAFIDRAMAYVFARCAIDPARMALAGFSDGASYALSLGVTNGDVFEALLAFSPGYFAATKRRGAPRIFESHGTRDQVLPIDDTSRRLVPALRARGLQITYVEFDGPHTLTPDIARQAADWLLGSAPSPRR